MLLNHPAPIELRIDRIERTVRPNKAFKHSLSVPVAAGEDFLAPAFVRVARGICSAEDVLFSGVQCQQRSKGILRQFIVRVEKRKPFAFCRRNARVPRPIYAAVFLMKDTNPFIRLRPCVQCRAVPSSEPSSTARSSQSAIVCARRLLTARSSAASQL